MNGHVAKGHGTTLGLKFTCHVCGAPGSSRASLKRHLIRTHKIERVDHPELLTKKVTNFCFTLKKEPEEQPSPTKFKAEVLTYSALESHYRKNRLGIIIVNLRVY